MIDEELIHYLPAEVCDSPEFWEIVDTIGNKVFDEVKATLKRRRLLEPLVYSALFAYEMHSLDYRRQPRFVLAIARFVKASQSIWDNRDKYVKAFEGLYKLYNAQGETWDEACLMLIHTAVDIDEPWLPLGKIVMDYGPYYNSRLLTDDIGNCTNNFAKSKFKEYLLKLAKDDFSNAFRDPEYIKQVHWKFIEHFYDTVDSEVYGYKTLMSFYLWCLCVLGPNHRVTKYMDSYYIEPVYEMEASEFRLSVIRPHLSMK